MSGFDPSQFVDTDDFLEDVIEATEEDVQEYQDFLTRADKRLDMAQYFRLLIDSPLFEEQNDTTRIVEKQVGIFIRGKLNELLGIERPRQEVVQQFTDEEADVLRAIIAKVTKTPSIVTPPTPSPVRRQEARPQPTVRQVRAAPVKAAVAAKPTVPTAPAAKKTEKVKEEKKASSDIKKDKAGRLKKAVVNEDGNLVEIDVTPQVVPTNRVPMPTGSALSSATQQTAMGLVGAIGGSLSMEYVTKD